MPPTVLTRKGYTYSGVAFSPDGRTAMLGGCEHHEVDLPPGRRRRFNVWIAAVILFTCPGIPLMAHFGFQSWFIPIILVFACLVFLFDRHIHRCVRCGRGSRKVTTPYNDAPVLFLCSRCGVFFEHGHIDGGLPKSEF